MKFIHFFIFPLFFLLSCIETEAELGIDNILTSDQPVNSNFNVDTIRTKSEWIPRYNYTDSAGLKQGQWITRGYKNRIKKIETFVNDTLHGYWMYETGGFQLEGHYEKGKKQGYFWEYRIHTNRHDHSAENSDIYMEYFYQYDSVIWALSPETDMKRMPPIRRTTTLTRDTVHIQAIYRDGSKWYKGTCVNGKPVGVHHIYLPNGNLVGVLDYENGVIEKLDHEGNVVESATLHEKSFDLFSID